ncbi:MAG: RraA family protein [Lachnospiraceae bacterium]|jgi:RraA family protein
MGNVGFRQFLNFKRADKELVKLFKDLPTPNICDNMNRMYSMHGLVPFNKTPLLGTAFTVRVPAGNNLMFNRALDIAQPGDIIVVDGGACAERALCGEIMISHAIKRGLGGFIINGYIRDTEAIATLPFPVFAMGAVPNGPLKNGPGEIGVPVSIGGMVVMPGDIVVGDADGLVVIRPEDAAEVAEKAKKQNAGEAHILELIEQGTWDRSGFIKTLAEMGCEIIE